jgi:8-oxo-dGTP diphosphatase
MPASSLPSARSGGPAVAEPIRIAAALIDDGGGRLLLVRKRGTSAFMQAGGKIDPGETPFEALARELDEELGFRPAVGDVRFLGRFEADAANEPGRRLEAHLFHLPSPRRDLRIAAELEEALWVTPDEAERLSLAPSRAATCCPSPARCLPRCRLIRPRNVP